MHARTHTRPQTYTHMHTQVHTQDGVMISYYLWMRTNVHLNLLSYISYNSDNVVSNAACCVCQLALTRTCATHKRIHTLHTHTRARTHAHAGASVRINAVIGFAHSYTHMCAAV